LDKKISALIFDLDGTLYDIKGFARRLVFARPGEAAVILAERRTRKGLSGCDYGSAGVYYREFFSRMSRLIRKPPEDLRAWYFDRYMPRMGRIIRKYCRLRPGAAELFAGLARGSFPVAVYSDYPQTAERLAALSPELPAAGVKLYGPEHFGAQKPAVRPFLTIAADLGAAPEETLVIGDRDGADGAGAAAAGMAYIGIGNRKQQKKSPYSVMAWEACLAQLREHRDLQKILNPWGNP
jgi:FMN phosphatase YigB (HAD superfamily)